MIDMVFLLLIYFMVSSTLERQEADLGFSLPGTAQQSAPVAFPDETVVVLTASGQPVVNDYPLDDPAAARYVALEALLSRLQQSALSNRTEAEVTLSPDPETPHRAIIKAMDAVSAAGITGLRFATATETF